MVGFRCQWCGDRLPITARSDARFCSTKHRVASHRSPVPPEMSALPRWVRHSKKRPITTRGFAASSTAPSTWSSFAEAKAAASVGDGLGFVLTGDGIICLDIDHCLSGGRPNPATAELLARTPATFIEVSPSGDGLHVWGKGHVERGRKLPSLEVYGAGRYITVTGERFRRSPAVLADLSEVLSLLI